MKDLVAKRYVKALVDGRDLNSVTLISEKLNEVSKAFKEAHDLGMATILWCYLRNGAFKVGDVDYSLAADLSGQANHLGVTIEADISKQKLPENNGGYNALKFGKTDARV